jgi:hypothetical protein
MAPPTARRSPEPRDRDQRAEARRSRPSGPRGPATSTFAPCATAVDRSAQPEPPRRSRQRRRGRSPSNAGAHAEHARAVCPVWPATATPYTPAIVTRGSRHVTASLEPKLRDNRRARGVAHAPCRHPRDTSTRHPPLPYRRPPLATTTPTRCLHRIDPIEVEYVDQRLPPVLPQTAPTAAKRRAVEPATAARRGRPAAEATNLSLCTTIAARARPDTQAGAPQQTITSAHSARCPEPIVPTSPPTRSAPRVRASSPVPNRIARRSGLHRAGANPSSAVARREPKPAPPVGNEAAKRLDTTSRHPRAVSPPRDCMASVEDPWLRDRPSGRTLPARSRTTHVAELDAVSRGDRSGVATVAAAARHPRSRRSTDPTPLRVRKASALHPVTPKRRTTRPLQNRYRATSPGRPPSR